MTPFLVALAAISSALLGVYGINLVYLSVRALRLKPRPAGTVARGSEPHVCVQVPIYNERYVATRAIAAVCSLDWPRDRLEVQVLDDSDDATTEEVALTVERWRARGLNVSHIRRGARSGFKAGALAYGFAATQAPFLAIFDADFVPPPDFLRRVMAGFTEPDVGWVQARWGHLNETYSLLTRLQALMIDFHFLVEQAVRPALGYPTNFTGTAGVWRRDAITGAGGWSARTVAEDLDLSYRAQFAGWRGVFLEDVVAPQELPVAAAAYRGQQLRWATGTFQCARLLLPALLRAPLPAAARFQGSIRLLSYFAPLLMLLQVALYPVLVLSSVPGPVLPLALAANLLSLAPAAGLTAAQVRCGRGWWRPLPAVLAWSLLGAGTSLAVVLALGRALRPQAFNRTPKYRIERQGQEWRDRDYVVAVDPYAPVELLVAVACACLTYLEIHDGRWLVSVYSTIFAAGFTLLGGLSLLQSLQVLTLRRLGRHTLEMGQRGARTAGTLAPAAALLVVIAGFGVAFEDSYGHWLMAANLASGHGLHDPLFGMEDSWLPAYHVFAAGVLLVFGWHSLWALRALSIGLGLVVLVLTARLAGSTRRGRITTALLVLNPAFLLTFTSAVAEPLITACLMGTAAALQAGRAKAAALLAAVACLAGTKAWLWIGAAVAVQSAVWLAAAGWRRPRGALRWAVPALVVLALLQLAFSPAEHSVARASVEVASATQRGSVSPAVLGRAEAFTGWFALASLPVLLLAPLGLLREIRARSASLLALHVPSLAYLLGVTALVALGTYSGSERYYVLALPSLAVLAAAGVDALPPLTAVAATACAGLVAIAYAPVLGAFAAENAGLLASGRATAAVPGRLLTDSPAAAYASGKPPSEIAGSRALPASSDAATTWLEERGFGALVLEDVSYYHATSVFPELVAGRPAPPFIRLGPAEAFDVAGGKHVTGWVLPPAGMHAPVGGFGWLGLVPVTPSGKTAPLERGVTLQVPGNRDAAGEGMGFGVPVVHSAGSWFYPGSASTEILTDERGTTWRKTFELDRTEVDDASGRFVRFEAVPSRGRVTVDYRIAGDRLHVQARASGLTGFDRLVLLNEESAAFDDYADTAHTLRGAAIGPEQQVTGGWARLRSGSLGVEFMVEQAGGSTMLAGRELDPARGLDWSGVGYQFGAGFESVSYEITFRRAR